MYDLVIFFINIRIQLLQLIQLNTQILCNNIQKKKGNIVTSLVEWITALGVLTGLKNLV